MRRDQKAKCRAIIHGAAATAATAASGLAQLPCSDNAVLVPIEVAMVISLGRVFGISLNESAAKGMVAGSVGTVVGRGAVQLLVGWVPVVGNAINAATAAAVVEGLGWIAAKDFSSRTV